MNIKLTIIALAAFLILSPQASQAQSEPAPTIAVKPMNAESITLQNIFKYTKEQNPDQAKTQLTSRSHTLYDRIVKHDLIFLLPNTVETSRSKDKNGFHYVEFIDPAKSQDQTVIMAFEQKPENRKLDLPETFRIGLGNDWQNTLSMIEQSYTFMRGQYGKEKAAKMVQTMVNAGR